MSLRFHSLRIAYRCPYGYYLASSLTYHGRLIEKNIKSSIMHGIQKIRPIFKVIDLNAILYNRRSFALQGATDEHPTVRLYSNHGFPADARISQRRPALPRGLQNQKLLLSRSIPLPGFCPTNLPGKPPRYRGLSSNHAKSDFHMGIRGRVSRCKLAYAN